MKRHLNWQLLLGLALLALSAVVYVIHYLIFRDVHHIFIYLIGDIGFVFIEVLLVTLILHEVLALREKRAILQKLNMVIGAFFSEVGSELLRTFSSLDPHADQIRDGLILTTETSDQDFSVLSERLAGYDYQVTADGAALKKLGTFLVGKRSFLLRLLENPNLLEHDRFTDLLWAVTHLDEELEARTSFVGLPDKDLEHLAVDIQRMYDHLASEWMDYVQHLKSKYPFLFSLVLRTHPFQEQQSPIIS